jgi:RNA polymerase sigma-70 factor (ECF subfamily)
MSSELDFENLVTLYYKDLYRFAFSMTHSETDASDLTQQTFYIWATKGDRLREPGSVKSWLFTTMHREFLQLVRRRSRFTSEELSAVADELPSIAPNTVEKMDAHIVMQLLGQIDENFRAPLVLYYIEDRSYKEIAELLGIPLGTVQSRIARGKAHLYRLIADVTEQEARR